MSRRHSSIEGVPMPLMRLGADRFVRQRSLEHALWLAADRTVTPCGPHQRHGRPADIVAATHLVPITIQHALTGATDQAPQLQSP